MPEGVGYGPQFVASTGLNLNVIGNHAYAYSGALAGITTSATALSFTTGNYLFVGELQLNAAIDPTAPSTGTSSLCIITLNDAKIAIIVSSAAVSTPETFASVSQPLIIPAYTAVLATVDSGANVGEVTVTMTGRIYGKIE